MVEKTKGYQQSHRVVHEKRLARCKIQFEKSKKRLAVIPTCIDSIHFPMPKGKTYPDDSKFVRILETVEAHIRQGKRIVIYDRNGHGRVALFSAILLGRLYGLHGDVAISRVQRYHDQQLRMRSNNSTAPITCPETAAQSQQIIRILTRTSRPLYDSWELQSQFGREQCFRQRRGFGLPRWIDRYKKRITRSGNLSIALETSDEKHQVRTPRDGVIP